MAASHLTARTPHAGWLTDAIHDAIDRLKSDDGYERIANGEKWPYIVEALMQAAGVDPRQNAAIISQIEALDRSWRGGDHANG